MDCGDAVYDQPSNDAFANKLKTVQYNAASTIMGVIKGTSRKKLYQELGLEYLQQRRWMRRLPAYMSLRNGVLFVLAWVAWVARLRGWCASVGALGACLRGWRARMGGVLAWVGVVLAWATWAVFYRGLCGWCASVGKVVGVLAWVAY